MSAVAIMAKAERTLAAAERALASEDGETAAERAYYAVYFAAWAALESAGIAKPKTHRGMIAEFSQAFVKKGPLTTSVGAILSRL